MRRVDREVKDINEIISIIKKCDVCRIGLNDCDYPYIVPLNFGFSMKEGKIELYFHGASVGKKMDLIKQNDHAFFEMDCSHKLIEGDRACKYTMEFESVMGNGTIEIVHNEEKKEALTNLMRQYSTAEEFHFEEREVNSVTVFKLTVDQITGKRLKK